MQPALLSRPLHTPVCGMKVASPERGSPGGSRGLHECQRVGAASSWTCCCAAVLTPDSTSHTSLRLLGSLSPHCQETGWAWGCHEGRALSGSACRRHSAQRTCSVQRLWNAGLRGPLGRCRWVSGGPQDTPVRTRQPGIQPHRSCLDCCGAVLSFMEPTAVPPSPSRHTALRHGLGHLILCSPHHLASRAPQGQPNSAATSSV